MLSSFFLSVFITILLIILLTCIKKLIINKPKKDISPKNKIIFVTGAAGGFGIEFCKQFLQLGCKVIATDISLSLLEQNLSFLIKQYNNQLKCIEMDVSNLNSILQCKEKVNEILTNEWKRDNVNSNIIDRKNNEESDIVVDNSVVNNNRNYIYALINNAGIANSPKTQLRDGLINYNDEELIDMFNVNTIGPIRIIREFKEFLKYNSQNDISPLQKSSNKEMNENSIILNIASAMGLFSRGFMGFYPTTKHALVGFTTTLQKELVHIGIRVCCVCPGFATTNIINLKPFNEKSLFYKYQQLTVNLAKRLMKNAMTAESVVVKVAQHCFSTNCAKRVIIDRWLIYFIFRFIIIWEALSE
ncbi:hypothetical protein ABK040_007675 [Willaertia magna]